MSLWSRRRVLATSLLLHGSALKGAQGSRVEQEAVTLTDALTGRTLDRLTDVKVLFHFPHYHHRFLASNNRSLILGGEADGTRQIHYYDLRRNRITQLTGGEGTFPHSATMDDAEKELFYLQGDGLNRTSLNGRGQRQVFRCPGGWRFTGHMSISEGAQTAAVVEIREDDYRDDPTEQVAASPQCRIRVVDLASGKDRLAVTQRAWLTHPQFRPGRRELLYTQEAGAELGAQAYRSSIDEKNAKPLRPADGGRVERAYWATGGGEARFVHFPDESLRGATIRSVVPETGAERRIARCSAFGWLQENVDGSAYVGASKRPSGPNIYVLFPSLDREITLCEHGATRKPYPIAGTDRLDYFCASPETVFSHDSQWVYFNSDREGQPAVYRMKVEDLVEST
jgi:oligogalacturonide lyase